MEITYTRVGDYYLPDLVLPPEEDTRPIGVWGKRRKQYLMNHNKALFTIMTMDNTLHTHLADINEQADDMFFRLVNDMAKTEGITEQLKAEDQMLWVQKMNNIRNRAMEIVNEELIYV
ncbi:MAG: TnpV protein [Clostridia bacterium]|nr:TnpV protein [Clostridia bacterium]